jgi:predicted DNA-binding protein (UPF0251 family)
MRDCGEKQRFATGVRNGNYTHPESRPRGAAHKLSKLTEQHVVEIRVLHAAKMRGKDIAKQFGVSNATVSEIVNRVIWTHV